MALAKKYHLDGKYYTILEIKKITGITVGTIRSRLNAGAASLNDMIKPPKKNKRSVNWNNSMMNDKSGFWALINKALRPYDK
jgi:hypothetical protein